MEQATTATMPTSQLPSDAAAGACGQVENYACAAAAPAVALTLATCMRAAGAAAAAGVTRIATGVSMSLVDLLILDHNLVRA